MAESCPICSSRAIARLDARDDVPIIMNRIYATSAEARAAKRGPLALAGCTDCGFVWNTAFDPELIVYDGEYENDQTFSPSFARHFEQRARDIVAAVAEDEPLDFLEVGSGQGRFIEEVARVAGPRLHSAEGFDPAWRGREGEGPAGSHIHTCYFDKSTAGLMQYAPNVVATRHTIEHVPDPVAFLSAIREALGPDARAAVFVETPCVEWILRHEAMQDFFYEHCSLFTADSLADALHRAGFRGAKVEHVFGDQYLWARAFTYGEEPPAAKSQGDSRPALEGVRQAFVKKWREDVARRAGMGRVALWGAGAKGVNFALMTDPEARHIDHIVDVNPGKQGRHVPGSGLKVLSPKDAAARGARTIYVMNPNYLDEIRATAAEIGIVADFIPIN